MPDFFSLRVFEQFKFFNLLGVKIRISLAIVAVCFFVEAVSERLKHRSCEKKVPNSIPRFGITVEVIS